MMAAMLRVRPSDAHKGTMGHALLVAGSSGVAGCAVLAGEALLRSGAGKLTIVTPEANRVVLQTALPEAITSCSMPPSLAPYQALGIGPGIGLDDGQLARLRSLLRDSAGRRMPLVVDGDGLRLLARMPDAMNLLDAHVILTPHRGEMQALAESLTPGAASLEESAREIARRSGAVVVLKGHPSLVFVNGSETYACPRGNSGMATAGSGDVLMGLITGLLAQGYAPDEAARLGVWLHATAGDKAAGAMGEECMLARDITAHLPQAYAELRKTKTAAHGPSLCDPDK